LPRIQAMLEKYGGQGLVVVGIHDPLGARNLSTLLSRNKITYAVGTDSSLKPNIRRYRVKGYPTFTFIARDGKIRFADVHFDSVEAAIDMLLKEAPAGAPAKK
jgi:hypothetical protein